MVREVWDRRCCSPFAVHRRPGRADRRTTSAHCPRRLPQTAPAPKPAITAAASRTGQQGPPGRTEEAWVIERASDRNHLQKPAQPVAGIFHIYIV